jgi:hypothetical protein
MPFMLKIQWNIKSGSEADFKANQQKLCKVMLDDHPGVICYHVDYPSANMSQWVEVYATDEAFAAHLDDAKGKQPLGAIIDACDKITCQCWGDPNDASKEILKGFGATYHQTGKDAFVLNPQADKDSVI